MHRFSITWVDRKHFFFSLWSYDVILEFNFSALELDFKMSQNESLILFTLRFYSILYTLMKGHIIIFSPTKGNKFPSFEQKDLLYIEWSTLSTMAKGPHHHTIGSRERAIRRRYGITEKVTVFTKVKKDIPFIFLKL